MDELSEPNLTRRCLLMGAGPALLLVLHLCPSTFICARALDCLEVEEDHQKLEIWGYLDQGFLIWTDSSGGLDGLVHFQLSGPGGP